MEIRLIGHNTADYQNMILLRRQVLLEPLGIPVSFINQAKEKTDFLLAAFEKEEMIGCCVLTPAGETTIQLRQMAVPEKYQGKHIGSAIMNFAEHTALKNGFGIVMMHAREKAVPFYKKCGYAIAGGAFSEVGMVHFKMQKRIQ